MNERIEELADQAITEKLTLTEFVDALKAEPHDFYGFRIRELEQFAKLIVRECTDICEEYSCTGWDEAAKRIADRIKERFGVE